ncbi:hypothetical protein SAMN04488104_103916 [Algoriphagus faecimaris]|uniref:Uncharacterized protein n=1 Tax=Algoriphagus faecimaris TaxID=686796 RepID=A0A1G6VY06_9BACT|nr:hypothetical protein [Algoriphagus faecimaris]SDD58414.1 hypothetical protein SAMN04488104_103916 [Algoriphagus faecimaris]
MAFFLDSIMRFLLVLFFLEMSTCLFACECIFLPLDDAFRNSDFVGIGTVKKVHAQDPSAKTKKVEFEVSQFFKGVELDQFFFDFDLNNLCMGGDLKEGEKYLMYLDRRFGIYRTNLCLGRHFPVRYEYVMKRELQILQALSETSLKLSDSFRINFYGNDFFTKINKLKIPKTSNEFGIYLVKYYSQSLKEVDTISGFDPTADYLIESAMKRSTWNFEPKYDNEVTFPVTFLIVLDRGYSLDGKLFSISRYDRM